MRPEDQTPLKPRGLASAPKFLEDSQNKFLANEDENAYVQIEVFGDPAPKAQWFRGEIDLSEVGRFKFWTDGVRGMVFMGIENCTKADEGVYRCIITNRFGKREHKFKLFISRSFRKAPPKREIPVYWSDIPKAKFVKQGSTDQVSFTAKLTVSDLTGKWFFKDQAACSNGEKYQVTQGGGAFTLVIKNPSPEDTGCYKCVLDNLKELFCETYLDVQLPDPEYIFLKHLPNFYQGNTGRPLTLSCLCAEDAKVSWHKDEEEINEEDEHYKTDSTEGEHILEINSPEDKDSARYSCKIIKFGKEGESETSCLLKITDFPHKFAKPLAETISLVERENLLLQTTTHESFASVKWLKNGQELAVGRKRNQRVKLIVREGLHCLAIDRCTVSDQGVYTAKTNVDVTSCDVHVAEFPHIFTKRLPDIAIVTEDGKVAFEVEVEDEEAVVSWFHDDIEFQPERSRIARLQITAEGRYRALSIKKCAVEDAATISARTNADKTTAELTVKCHNSFSQRLFDTAECSEHCKMEFLVQVKDKTSPVYFLLDRFQIDFEDGRFEQVDMGGGHHKLKILRVSKKDEGVLSCKIPTNRGDEMVECKCIFNVTEGESPPFIGKVEPVSCVAILHSYSDRMNSYIHKEGCKLVVPYKIEGTRKSTLDILVEKEGQEVEMGNDIQMKVRSDRVVIDIMNPQRTNSGIYKVTISNDQGSCEIDVPVEVLDIPSPPLSISVSEVRKNSAVVQWKAPEDDGGTSIKHFVTEILDLSTNNMWTSVAMTDTGDCREQLVQHLHEGHRYCFRVAAANRIGQSESRESIQEITTKDPWDAPYACGRAQIIDWTPTFADISWTGPTHDGGSPVTSFIIEIKESSMRDWTENCVIPIEEVEYEGDLYRGRCENLQEEYEYRFRVVAVNRAGKSKAGSASEAVIAMHKNVSPYIKGEGLKDIKLKEGKPFRFDVWVGGEPVPSIEWLKDDVRVTNDDMTSLSVYTKASSAYTLKNVVLSIPKAIEDIHGGVYKLRLKNESGVFESAGSVDIDGPPEKKAKKLAIQKAQEEKEQKEKEEKEKDEENFQNYMNRKLSDIKGDIKDEDKDSGLKIGEESANGSETSYEYTDASEEDEDFYEEETPFDTSKENNINSLDHGNENSISPSNGVKENQNEIIAFDSGESAEAHSTTNNVKNEAVNVCQHKESDTNTKTAADSTNAENIYNVDDSSSGISCNSNTKSHHDNKLDGELSQPSDEVGVTCDYSNLDRNEEGDRNKEGDRNEEGDINEEKVNNEEFSVVKNSNYHDLSDNSKKQFNESETSEKVFKNDSDNSELIDINTACKDEVDPESQHDWGENRMKNVENSSNFPNSGLSNDHFEYAEQNVSADKIIQKDLNMSALGEEKLDTSIHDPEIQSKQVCFDQTNAEQIDDEHLMSTESVTFADSEQIYQEQIEEPPVVVFDLEQHIANLQDQLDSKLKTVGFSRSETVSDANFGEGDKCLIALLDQMNREDQDFKVWERDDYSFLRWYVTKQMETLKSKVDNLKFVEAIEGDVQTYIDKMSDDGISLDRAFIQAAATIFNKDIILIPTEGETDFEVVVGGLSSPRGKGAPLYLGHIKQSENNQDFFISVMPDQIDSNRIASILAGDLINVPDIVTEDIETQPETAMDVEEVVIEEEEAIDMPSKINCRQWKRMDSYTGSASKELDHIIQDILNEDSLVELNKSLSKCEVETESESEISKTFENSEDSNRTELFPESEPEQDAWKEDLKHDATYYYCGDTNVETESDQVVNVVDSGYVIGDELIDEVEFRSSIEHNEKQLEHVETEENSVTDLSFKNEENNDQDYFEGWTYDSTTGYWVEDNVVPVEELNETMIDTCEIIELKSKEDKDVKFDISELVESSANIFIKDTESFDNQVGESFSDHDQNQNCKEKIESGESQDDHDDQTINDNLRKTETNEFDNHIEQEIISSVEEVCITENNPDNDTKEAEQPYFVNSQDHNEVDSNHSQHEQTAVDLKETEKEESANHDEDAENVAGQEHELKMCRKETEIIDNNVNDGAKEESCEGWTYDPDTGYWTEDAIEYSEENSPNINEAIPESDPLEDLAENYIAQFQEVKADAVYAPLEENNEYKNDSIQLSDNSEVEKENFKNISERLENLAGEYVSKSQDIKTSPSSDKNLDCSDRLTSTHSCDRVEGTENPFSDPSKDIQSSKEITSIPLPNLGQDTKLVRRIKIKVSVTPNDQVKEFDDNADCDPVALDLSSSNDNGVLPDIMDCVSGENTKEISEINESPADKVESTQTNESIKNDSQFGSINIDNDNIDSDKSCGNDTERSEGRRGPIKKYTKKLNNAQKKMLNKEDQTSEIKLEDMTANCVNVPNTDPNTCLVQTADGQTTEVKMRAPLRQYSRKRTASFRWSGTEMFQVDGPQVGANSEPGNVEVIKPNIDRLQETRQNISYKKASAALDNKLSKLGFARSPSYTEFHKDGDNCLKALIDQMSLPGQDFKVWDREDYSFLRWYIAKQLEIQISAGKAENYVKFSIDSPQAYVSNIQKDEEFIDNDYLYSVAKIFNKDIVVIDSSNPTQELTYIKGGQNDLQGKGKPIFLGHLTKEDAGKDFYQSVVPDESVHIEHLLSSLQ
eukprot:GFUD01000912.1.p1 GENE.GFUD01000912.1~~GFUD01000912.1.p1  ORF type:complete len:2609 (-),score=679.76 GFUD01000912.1:80-7906(-)